VYVCLHAYLHKKTHTYTDNHTHTHTHTDTAHSQDDDEVTSHTHTHTHTHTQEGEGREEKIDAFSPGFVSLLGQREGEVEWVCVSTLTPQKGEEVRDLATVAAWPFRCVCVSVCVRERERDALCFLFI
jgi:hypothetical protein